MLTLLVLTHSLLVRCNLQIDVPSHLAGVAHAPGTDVVETSLAIELVLDVQNGLFLGIFLIFQLTLAGLPTYCIPHRSKGERSAGQRERDYEHDATVPWKPKRFPRGQGAADG